MEQFASPMKGRIGKETGSYRLLQILLCAGALVAASALTIEARIRIRATQSAATAAAPSAPQPQAISKLGLSSAQQEAEQAAARRILAAALARAKAPGQNTSISGSAQSNAASSSLVASALQKPRLSEAELKQLADKAAQALKTGDIASARLVLRRAAGAGDATALFALGETYDPDVLAKMRVRGLKGDPARALALYRRAAAQGVPQARDRLKSLSAEHLASVD